jgi:hypothetical protein
MLIKPSASQTPEAHPDRLERMNALLEKLTTLLERIGKLADDLRQKPTAP